MARKQNDTDRILNKIRKDNRSFEPKSPIASGMYLPNHSGDHSAGILNTNPTAEKDLVNKEYVDNIATRGDIDFFLTENASDIATYFDMETDVVTATKENIVQSITGDSTTLIASFATILNDEEVERIRLLENGVYAMHLHAEGASNQGLAFYCEYYHRTAGGTETLIGTSHDSTRLTTSEAEYNVHATIENDTAFIAGDRIVLKIYGRNGKPTARNITIYMEGDTASRIEIPGFISLGTSVTASEDFTDNAIPRGDGGTRVLQDSGITISDADEIQLNKVGANIITATNAGGDLRLGAGGGTNDLKINTDGKIDIFEELNMNTKKIINVVDPTTNQEAATKKYVDDNAGAELAGVIKMYGAAAAPAGYVNCDGASLLRAGTYADLFGVIGTTYGTADGTHFNVPDMRGAFPRGAGTSTQFTQDHATTLGTYEDDASQGHYHLGGGASLFRSFGSTGGSQTPPGGTGGTPTTGGNTTGEITDGTNGTPRTANETRPNNLGVNFIIKF